jgi:hypothetical protein
MLMLLIIMDAFVRGDVYINFPYEGAKFRYEKESGKVYRRFYGEKEIEIPPNSELYNEAISAGEQISCEDYYRD